MELLRRTQRLIKALKFDEGDVAGSKTCLRIEDNIEELIKYDEQESAEFFSQPVFAGVNRTESLSSLCIDLSSGKNDHTLSRLMDYITENCQISNSIESNGAVTRDSESDIGISSNELPAPSRTESSSTSFIWIKDIHKNKDFIESVNDSIKVFNKKCAPIMKENLGSDDDLSSLAEFPVIFEKKLRENMTSRKNALCALSKLVKKTMRSNSLPLKPGFKSHDDNFYRIDNNVFNISLPDEFILKKYFVRYAKKKWNPNELGSLVLSNSTNSIAGTSSSTTSLTGGDSKIVEKALPVSNQVQLVISPSRSCHGTPSENNLSTIAKKNHRSRPQSPVGSTQGNFRSPVRNQNVLPKSVDFPRSQMRFKSYPSLRNNVEQIPIIKDGIPNFEKFTDFSVIKTIDSSSYENQEKKNCLFSTSMKIIEAAETSTLSSSVTMPPEPQNLEQLLLPEKISPCFQSTSNISDIPLPDNCSSPDNLVIFEEDDMCPSLENDSYGRIFNDASSQLIKDTSIVHSSNSLDNTENNTVEQSLRKREDKFSVASCVSAIVDCVDDCPTSILGELLDVTCRNEESNDNINSDTKHKSTREKRSNELGVDGSFVNVNESSVSAVKSNTNESDSSKTSNVTTANSEHMFPRVVGLLNTLTSDSNPPNKQINALPEKEPYVVTDDPFYAPSSPTITIDDDVEFTKVTPVDKNRHRLALKFSNPFSCPKESDAIVPVITLVDTSSKPPNTTFLLERLEEEFPVAPQNAHRNIRWRLIPLDVPKKKESCLLKKYSLPSTIANPFQVVCGSILDADHEPIAIPLVLSSVKRMRFDVHQEEHDFYIGDDPLKRKGINLTKPLEKILDGYGYSEEAFKCKKYEPNPDMTYEKHVHISSQPSYGVEESDLIKRGVIPRYGVSCVKRFKYPFHELQGFYWPIFQPTDNIPLNQLEELMVSDVYNQVTNLTSYTYLQKKALLCDSAPHLWNSSFIEAMKHSDKELMEMGRFKHRVSYARTFALEKITDAMQADAQRQTQEADWLASMIAKNTEQINPVTDREERLITSTEAQCISNFMVDHVRFNLIDKYSSSSLSSRIPRIDAFKCPSSWQRFSEDSYICANSRRNLLCEVVNLANEVSYKEIRNLVARGRNMQGLIDIQRSVIQAAYIIQRGESIYTNSNVEIFSPEDISESKKRIGKLKALIYSVRSEKLSAISDLWDTLALSKWEEKYWTLIWDNLASTYRKLPPVSYLAEKFHKELDRSYADLANLENRSEYSKVFSSSRHLRRVAPF